MAEPILIDTASMDPASALTGAELVAVVQGGADKRSTAQDIANLAPMPTAGVSGRYPPAVPSMLSTALWALPQSVAGAALGTTAIQNGWVVYVPFPVDRSIAVSDLALIVTTAIAGSAANAALFGSDPTSLLPGSRIGSAVSISTAATGIQSAAYVATLSQGLYWIALQSIWNATIRSVPDAVPLGYNTSAALFQILKASGTSIPSTAGTVALDAGAVPAVFMRYTEV